MGEYVAKRILIGVFSLFVLVAVAFFLTRAIPGSPFENASVSEDVLEMLEKEYGLNEPVTVQYGIYLKNILHGNLGYSYQDPSKPVTEVITDALPATLEIGIPAAILALAMGIPLGIWMACTEKKSVRVLIFAGTAAGTGIPNFVAALGLVLVFGVSLGLLPVAGLETWRHHILPVIALAIYPAAVVIRLTSNLCENELRKDYAVMAKAKGLPGRKIICTHVMKQIWIPVLNYMGTACTFLLTGSFVVESIFTVPGLGRQFVKSVADRDYTLIMGLTIFMGAVVIFVNLGVDILCACIDPRIRRSYYND